MPIILTVAMTGITELSERLRLLGAKNSEERDIIYTEVLTTLGEQLKTKLRVSTPEGETGDLARSTDFRVIIAPTEIEGETEYRLELIQTALNIGFTYRPIVVSGRLPGRVPPSLALRGWVQLKWGLTGPEVARGAFRLAKHIAAFGTQPNTYTSKVVLRNRGLIEEASNQLGQQLTVFISGE